MTASSGGSGATNGGSQATGTPPRTTPACNITLPPTSSVFQQIKQTQSSLARLSRVQQQLLSSQSNQTSQQQNSNVSLKTTTTLSKSTTFVDCLIRRFKDCFSEDFCTVPMFVVGNLSPGSDGTHLILPPCVSLGRQNINRFASPKNLRLINSIRDSCKSIEELDLGGNKFNDLIEVYKILQCMPNLKFLNLSENDLSRTSPVAMATNSCLTNSNGPSSSSSSTSSFQQQQASFGSNTITNFAMNNAQQQQHLSASSITLNHINNNNSRACLAPINQNNSQQQVVSAMIGSRRHSTLGQQSSGSLANNNSVKPTLTSRRATEARRMAAAAAVAQSKKTSSIVASKLTNSATSSAVISSSGQCAANKTLMMTTRSTATNNGSKLCTNSFLSTTAPSTSAMAPRDDNPTAKLAAKGSSTMQMARSLSSLSAKDIRAASSSMARQQQHYYTNTNKQRLARQHQKETNQHHHQHHHHHHHHYHQLRRSTTSLGTGQEGVELFSANGSTRRGANNCASGKHSSLLQTGSKSLLLNSASEHNKQRQLFDEPIVETDNDMDLSDNNNHNQAAVAAAATTTTTTIAPITSATNSQLNNTSNFKNPLQLQQQQQQQSTGNNYRRTFNSIKALALNNTGCQWKVVCSILNRMPNLEELHLSLNNYERIDLDPIEFKHHSLKRLYLCNNPKLTNWQELDKLLLAFPSLEALSIADCNISQIPDNLDRAREWRKLCGLNINGWPIKDWSVIERLNQLPSLSDLKCRNLEILNSIDEPRHHLIARLPKLQKLNGSEIEEREHAEKAFLRFFMTNSHLERPSRYYELVQIHGEIIPVDVDVDLSPPSQASIKVIYLNRNFYKKENEDDVIMSEDFLIKLMDNAEQPSTIVNSQQQEPISLENNNDSMDIVATTSGNNNNNNLETGKQAIRLFKDEGQEVLGLKIDLRQSVRKFKSTLGQLFGLDSQNLILYYIDHEMVGLMGPELIKHNQKKLWNYNVQDGDQFIVEER